MALFTTLEQPLCVESLLVMYMTYSIYALRLLTIMFFSLLAIATIRLRKHER